MTQISVITALLHGVSPKPARAALVTKDTALLLLLLPKSEGTRRTQGTQTPMEGGLARQDILYLVWRNNLCLPREFHKSLTPPTLNSGEGSAEFYLRTSCGSKERQSLLIKGGIAPKIHTRR